MTQKKEDKKKIRGKSEQNNKKGKIKEKKEKQKKIKNPTRRENEIRRINLQIE